MQGAGWYLAGQKITRFSNNQKETMQSVVHYPPRLSNIATESLSFVLFFFDSDWLAYQFTSRCMVCDFCISLRLSPSLGVSCVPARFFLPFRAISPRLHRLFLYLIMIPLLHCLFFVSHYVYDSSAILAVQSARRDATKSLYGSRPSGS